MKPKNEEEALHYLMLLKANSSIMQPEIRDSIDYVINMIIKRNSKQEVTK